MNIITRDFGEIEINEEDIITFTQPVIGFDDYKKFVILHDEDTPKQIAWIQSVEEAGLCFIVVDPFTTVSDYKFNYPESVKQYLGDGEYEVWLIMVVSDDVKKSTVNLKSPILVNPGSRTAMQLILEEDYPIRYPLFEKKGDK